jgi:hypothetical protein
MDAHALPHEETLHGKAGLDGDRRQRWLRNPHGLGFIKDDSQDFLKQLTAQSVQTKPHEGYTLVKIYRETAMKVAA